MLESYLNLAVAQLPNGFGIAPASLDRSLILSASLAQILIGLAMAHGKRIIVVSPDWWSFSCHGNVRCYPNLEAAVGSLVASAAGARLQAA
jgi:hypothetical protein